MNIKIFETTTYSSFLWKGQTLTINFHFLWKFSQSTTLDSSAPKEPGPHRSSQKLVSRMEDPWAWREIKKDLWSLGRWTYVLILDIKFPSIAVSMSPAVDIKVMLGYCLILLCITWYEQMITNVTDHMWTDDSVDWTGYLENRMRQAWCGATGRKNIKTHGASASFINTKKRNIRNTFYHFLGASDWYVARVSAIVSSTSWSYRSPYAAKEQEGSCDQARQNSCHPSPDNLQQEQWQSRPCNKSLFRKKEGHPTFLDWSFNGSYSQY